MILAVGLVAVLETSLDRLGNPILGLGGLGVIPWFGIAARVARALVCPRA